MRRTDIKLFVLIALIAGALAAIYSCTNPKDPGDSTAPTVTITNPTNASEVANLVDVRAEASDNERVTKVEFYIDAQLFYTDETAPWSCQWLSSSEASGEHNIFAKAFDAAGNTECSDLVVVTCENAAPAAVADLAATDPDIDGNLTLTWTAPGDDGSEGTAGVYDLRYYWSALTADNWESATEMEGEPTPQVAGSSESYDVLGIERGRIYYFALRTQDTAGNWSDVSNSVLITAMDLFADPVVYDVGGDLNGDILITDFDGDDNLDLAVSHRHADDNISILFGVGDGTFDPPVLQSTPGDASFVRAADFDSNGELDLVIPNWNADDTIIASVNFLLEIDTVWDGEDILSIDTSCLKFVDTTLAEGVSAVDFLYDEGGETYVTSEPWGFHDTSYMHCHPGAVIGAEPFCICVQYMDTIYRCPSTEGCPSSDIITYDSTRIYWYADDNPSSACVADFDGDDLLDVAIANDGTNNVSILFNEGGRSFGRPVNVNVGANRPSSICTADFDLDGWPDLAVSCAASDRVSVLHNLGDGTFESSTYDVEDNPGHIIVADVDTNGYVDLVITNYGSDLVSILMNRSDGTSDFYQDETFITGWSPSAVAAADLTGDGTPELVVTNYNSRDISVLINEGQFRYYSYNTLNYAVGNGPSAVQCADFDEDGDNDIVVLNDQDNTIVVLFNLLIE